MLGSENVSVIGERCPHSQGTFWNTVAVNTWETKPKALWVLLPEIVLWHWDASPGRPRLERTQETGPVGSLSSVQGHLVVGDREPTYRSLVCENPELLDKAVRSNGQVWLSRWRGTVGHIVGLERADRPTDELSLLVLPSLCGPALSPWHYASWPGVLMTHVSQEGI